MTFATRQTPRLRTRHKGVRHELLGPGGLAHLAARRELAHVGLDVEHGRAVDGVEAAHAERRALDAEQLAERHAEAVRACLRPLREDADLGPVGVVARAARAARDRLGSDEVEEVDDLDVAELAEAAQRVRAEARRELDRGLHAGPVVVDGLRARRGDVRDRRDLERLHAASLRDVPPRAPRQRLIRCASFWTSRASAGRTVVASATKYVVARLISVRPRAKAT